MRLLASHCKPGARIPALLPDAAQLLLTYEWPGNVRELENVMQRALVLCEGDLIRAGHIAFEPAGPEPRAATAVLSPTAAAARLAQNEFASAAPGALAPGPLADSLALAERQIILTALRAHASRERAANQLGISPRTLRYKLARLRAAGVDLSDEIQMSGSAA
jgi:two-component system response regulator FlrC